MAALRGLRGDLSVKSSVLEETKGTEELWGTSNRCWVCQCSRIYRSVVGAGWHTHPSSHSWGRHNCFCVSCPTHRKAAAVASLGVAASARPTGSQSQDSCDDFSSTYWSFLQKNIKIKIKIPTSARQSRGDDERGTFRNKNWIQPPWPWLSRLMCSRVKPPLAVAH